MKKQRQPRQLKSECSSRWDRPRELLKRWRSTWSQECAQDAESAACMSVSGEAKAIASSVAVTAAHDIDDPCACKRPESVLQQLVPDEEVPFSFCSHRVVHSSRTCITCP